MNMTMAFEIAKRDAIRIFCDRLREWLDRQVFAVDPGDSSLEYRKGWNDAIKHVYRHITGS